MIIRSTRGSVGYLLNGPPAAAAAAASNSNTTNH